MRDCEAIFFIDSNGDTSYVLMSEQPDFPFLGETMSRVRQERMRTFSRGDAALMIGAVADDFLTRDKDN